MREISTSHLMMIILKVTSNDENGEKVNPRMRYMYFLKLQVNAPQLGGNIWAQSELDLPQMRQIRDLFRSDFSQFLA